MSNAEFKAAFSKLLKKVGDKADLVVRKTMLELQNGMIEKSPVLTGRFKGAWQAGVGSANTSATSRIDKTSLGDFDKVGASLATQEVLKSWKPGQTIWLTNAMPYAKRLEYDAWSKQAPAGMVRLTVQNYSAYLAKAVKDLN
jgi:hypothetical protein